MSWGILLILWIGGWVTVIIIYARTRNKAGVVDFERQELVKNGNNLFATGLVYFIANLVSYLIDNTIVSVIAAIILTAFCVLPIKSCLAMFRQAKIFNDKYYWRVYSSGVIMAIIPLLMVVVLIFDRIINA